MVLRTRGLVGTPSLEANPRLPRDNLISDRREYPARCDAPWIWTSTENHTPPTPGSRAEPRWSDVCSGRFAHSQFLIFSRLAGAMPCSQRRMARPMIDLLHEICLA